MEEKVKLKLFKVFIGFNLVRKYHANAKREVLVRCEGYPPPEFTEKKLLKLFYVSRFLPFLHFPNCSGTNV